jgi:transcriptional regulator with XRE-family HTH domain
LSWYIDVVRQMLYTGASTVPTSMVMTMPVIDEFVAWLNSEAEARRWPLATVAQRIGVSPGDLVRVAQGQLEPSIDLCRRLAAAFDISEDEVFCHAGFASSDLAPERDEEALWEEAAYLFSQLSPGQQEMLLAFVRALLIEEQERQRSPESSDDDVPTQ